MFGRDWTPEIKKHNPEPEINDGQYAPKWPFRAIICGPSSSGKTFLLNSMLCDPDGDDYRVHFGTIYICAKDTEETAYKILRDALDGAERQYNRILEEQGLKIGSEPEKLAHWYNDPAELMGLLDSMDREERKLIIFDDQELASDKARLKIMEEFFQRARKLNCSMVFVAQTYYGTPKFIRRNCNYRFVFKPSGGKREINALLQDTPGSPEYVMDAATRAWNQPRGWIMIAPSGHVHIGFGPAEPQPEPPHE